MNIPSKIKKGDQLRSVAVDTINSLIDYLASTRIVQGMGIRLQQYAHGTVISTTAASVAAASVNGVSSYNGYFTLKDVSTYNEDGSVKEYRVAVCDGETWDPEKLTSGDSIASCMGNEITFKSVIFTIKQDIHIYIKCGPANTYLNKIISQPVGDQKPSRIGYEYVHIGSIFIRDKQLEIIQRLKTGAEGGALYVPYTQYSGDFALRLIEDEESDSVVSNKAVICNGMSWDPKNKNSTSSNCTINSVLTGYSYTNATIIDFSMEHKVYLYAKPGRGRNVRVDVISTKETPEMVQEGTYGYVLIVLNGKQCPPFGGLYNILLFNVGCDGDYPIITDLPEGNTDD